MTKKECIKRFNVKMQQPINMNEMCATKFVDYRNLEHPYCKDKSQYENLKFFLAFTNFETHDGKFGCYGYDSEEMTYDQALEAEDILKLDWERPGRRSWNSMNLIGIDENGNYFSVV